MSFTGFGADELQGASLKNASPTRAKGQRLKAKRTSHSFVDDDDDPVAGMIPNEQPAPITDQSIKRAQKQKINKQQQQRKTSKTEKKQPAVQREQSPEWAKTEEPVRSTVKNEAATSPPELKKLDIVEVTKRGEKLEQENKLRRAALAREVQSRTANILQEANKLKMIEEEIKRLDQLLAYDVSILRDKIDQSSLEYSRAKIRYHAAEKEYLAAKLDYGSKEETKDELVEQLMTLIQENEERKKDKLEGLVKKLDMSASDLSKMEAEEAEKQKRLEEAAAEAKRRNAEEEQKKLEAEEQDKLKKEEDEKKQKEAEEKSKEKDAEQKTDADNTKSENSIPESVNKTVNKTVSKTEEETSLKDHD